MTVHSYLLFVSGIQDSRFTLLANNENLPLHRYFPLSS